ncbi:conserved exported hypothetical protein [Verrucomicrobia bacterium]|nr:conserved exported hypothetical protein [Verrucomicrobiota bacterium]
MTPAAVQRLAGTVLGLASAFHLLSARADEGMWLYNNPPRQLLRDRYGFGPSEAWLEHLRLSSVRFRPGASGEFVSEDGLVLSNHHVGSRTLQRLSSQEHNYMRDGFYARTRAEEKPCPGLELNVLMSIEDVTARVNAAVQPGSSDEAAFRARRAVMAAIEKESLAQTGLRSEVITLYQGGQYHLYRFKRYTDVRLVFAPEEQMAFFGGDPDNFEYPRYDLDICIFRAYEADKPAHVTHYLKWSAAGPAENELVFVSGHPGRTDRLRTVAELEFLRDVEYPRMQERAKRVEVLLSAYSARATENARRARTDLFGIRNGRKLRDGALAGLLDPGFMQRKISAENQIRGRVAANTSLAELAGAWDRIAQAEKTIAGQEVAYDLLERGRGFDGVLFDYARHLIRAAVEQSKPNGERLEEYRESARASFEFELFSEQPVYEDLETLKLGDSLTYLVEGLGLTNEVVQRALAGKSPRDQAAETVRGSKLGSVAVRRRLYEGGVAALAQARDPMIELARAVDPDARALRKVEDVQHEAIRQAHAQIGKARYALEGSSGYPDATSSLRLAFGTTKGYGEDGRQVPFETTFAGIYQRADEHENRPPFDLSQRWVKNRRQLNLATPFNFVCTADIIGGNSGSPVVNRQGEFVGVIFDGNIQSLVADFVYTDEQARAVAVHSSAIIEALRKIYKAGPLADELLGKKVGT